MHISFLELCFQIGLNAMTFYGTLDLIQHVENNPNSGLEFIDLRVSSNDECLVRILELKLNYLLWNELSICVVRIFNRNMLNMEWF